MTLRNLLYTSTIFAVISTSAACAGATSIGAPYPGAESARSIRSGETLAGTLVDPDPRLEDGSRFHLYTFEGEAGEEVEITLQSDAFDAFVTLARPAGGTLKILESDDDGAEGTNARLSTILPATGPYVIRANAYSDGGLGDYQLSFASHGILPEPSRTAIRAGESVAGALSAGDAWLSGGSYYDLWEVEGNPGEVVRIDLESEAFDSYLSLGTDVDGEYNEIRSDDDGGDGLNARLYVTVPADGRPLVRARSLGEKQTGAYRITAASEGVARNPEPVAIAIGAEAAGTLDPLDARLENGIHYDVYTFSGDAGDTVVVEMYSEDFDTYLVLGTGGAGGFSEIASNDDGGAGTDSRIRHRLPSTGEYVIRARSFQADQTGAYTLVVAEPRPQPPVTRTPITLGTTARGSLDRSDPTIDGADKYHDYWTFHGAAGDPVRVELRSDDFDAYLAIGTEVDGEFRQIEFDDDGGEGRNSRIDLTLPATGEYVIRTTSFGSGETGDYTIILARRAGDPVGIDITEDVVIDECYPTGCGL